MPHGRHPVFAFAGPHRLIHASTVETPHCRPLWSGRRQPPAADAAAGTEATKLEKRLVRQVAQAIGDFGLIEGRRQR